MDDVAIRVENLSKLYHIGPRERYRALRDTLTDAMYAPFRAVASVLNGRRSAVGGQPSNNRIWALKDVCFEVKPGEVVGIIGRNGAGKSTLLKILSRITEPTEGYAEIHGRVGSLLEVGTGFHPELTGRENIYLNGAILGMKKAEIDRKLDEIVAFAEIEKFIDTPMKRYSSGMYMRLAFAVAAHLELDILLVDEVLAVGDVGFQKKCLGKMRETGAEGRTVLFVSHNMAALSSLCQRAILFESGQIVQEGLAAEIVQSYLTSFDDGGLIPLENRKDRYGDGRLRVTHVSLADAQGRPSNCLRSGEDGHIVVHYRGANQEKFRNVLVYIRLFTLWGERLCDFETDFVSDNFDEIGPIGRFVCSIPRVPLQAGSYPFTVSVYSGECIQMDYVENAGRIKVEQGDFYGSGKIPNAGILFVNHSWQYLAED